MTDRRSIRLAVLLVLLAVLLTVFCFLRLQEACGLSSADGASAVKTADAQPRRTSRHVHAASPATAVAASGSVADQAASAAAVKTKANEAEAQDLNVTLPTEEAYSRFLAALSARGLQPRRSLARLRAVSVRVPHSVLRELLSAFPELTWEYDMPVSVPEQPTERAVTSGRPFYDSLLPWLGIDPAQTDRGKGVTIAIIDEPVNFTASTQGADIRELDLFGLAANGGGDGHGNAVSSLLVADSERLQGIAPAASLLSVPVLDAEGNGSVFDVAAAIIAAADRGADIISLSLGSSTPSLILQQAVDYAVSKGAVLVASAGNDASGQPSYPAACDQVISVSACDASRNVTQFSNYGETVDIAAPGLGLTADFGGEGASSLELFSGTSAAAPCVAGALAALLSASPKLSPAEAADILLGTAADNGAPGQDVQYGSGTIDYRHAVNWNNAEYMDAAVAGQFLDLENATATATPLVLSAQNTGNTVLPELTLNATVNNQSLSRTFYNIQPGETVSETVQVPNDERNGLMVRSEVKTTVDEETGDNNVRTTRITVISPEEEE